AYYIFDIGGNGSPVSVTWWGFAQSQGDSYDIYAWNWTGTPAWEQIGTVAGTAVATVRDPVTFDLTTAHVGTGANIGLVHWRYQSGDGTKFGTDRILCSYSVVTQSVGYANGAVWVDTVNGTAGTTPFVHGTADNAVLTWANALTIAAAVGLERFEIVNGSTITLNANSDNFTFCGHEWTLVLAAQSIANAHISDANVTGVSSGSGAHFDHCHIGTGSFANGDFTECIFEDGSTITLLSAATYVLERCGSGGGSSPPIFDYVSVDL
ncbi:unnamed protein product, partial [marine sediment metagenome]